MSLQEVKDNWIYLDRNTGMWHKDFESAQGVFQPIHWVAMHRMQCMLRLMPHEGQIADIGCSYGILTLNMAAKKPRAHLLGIDPDAARLEVGNTLKGEHRLANVIFETATLDENSLKPGSCSGVVCTETLDHIEGIKPRLEEAVTKLMSLLKPGGRLLLSIPALDEMGKDAPRPPSPLTMQDFSFLKNIQYDRNCPRWWHLFFVDKK
ncbi:MAG TPA: class I SAM-dependent methyltransferase [Planctomycetota bacterium]|nr:class I SAM-dependent methyltransferase [Planctomycetota bacterium]